MKLMVRLSSLGILVLLVALLMAHPAAAQSYDWSNTGSTGNFLNNSFFNATATGPTLKFKSVFTGTIVKRYLVTNTFGSSTSSIPGWTTLRAAFTDDSANGSVVIKLFKIAKCDNTETQLCEIDSSDASGVQCESCALASSSDVDFANFSYWVEVTLSRTATSANEQIHSVALN
jgi:hypothetical protein